MGKSFYEEGKRLEKDAAKEAKRREKQEREENQENEEEENPALKDAVFAVMDQAYLLATHHEEYDVWQRDHYYKVRDLIQALTSAVLTQSYFRKLEITYQQEFGKFKRLKYDPRGYLIEPSGRIIQLGTREVKQYKFPRGSITRFSSSRRRVS